MNQPTQNTPPYTPPYHPTPARAATPAPRPSPYPRSDSSLATPANNKPVAKFKAGAITATIWANAAKGESGDVTFNNVTLDRRYTDKQGQWQSSSSLRVNDLPKAALVLQKAYEFLVLRDQEGASGRTENPAYGGVSITEEEVLIA